MTVRVSVVVPFFNAGSQLADCITGLLSQSLPSEHYEIILVDDGSTDGCGDLVDAGRICLIRQSNQGAPAARNSGVEVATGKWVAFTDSDCIPSRNWLRALLKTAEASGSEPGLLGAAGPMIGHDSVHAAARFVDITGGLDAERHLTHPLFPFAPTGNLMLRRSAINAVDGFDRRFSTYDACDLFTRLADAGHQGVNFAPAAMVLHRHRDSWGAYWRQQRGYGRGLAEFYLKYRDRIEWTLWKELGAWLRLGGDGLSLLRPGSADERLARRGTFIKSLAQRTAFPGRYWSPAQRRKW